MSHSDYTEGRYSLNITFGEVIHIGANLNISLQVGDTLDTSPLITSSNIRVKYPELKDFAVSIINFSSNRKFSLIAGQK